MRTETRRHSMGIHKRSIATVAVFFACVALASALSGQIMAVSGKVEYQDGKGSWKPLKTGDTINSGYVISTGFKSETTIKLGESILTVKPLTRMTLSQLVEREDIVDTELYLDEVGNVRAEVKSLNNKKNGFTVKSPIATASCAELYSRWENRLIVRKEPSSASTRPSKTPSQAGAEMSLSETSLGSQLATLIQKMEPIKLTSVPSTETTSPIMIVAPVTVGVIQKALNNDTSLVLTIN
jgi:hypothetical protein